MHLPLIKIIIFSIRDSLFALPSNYVKEIIDNREKVKEVSYGGKTLEGITSFDGNLISVLKVSHLLNPDYEIKEKMMLICKEKKQDKPVAILISGVIGMEVVKSADIEPSTEGEEYISGFVKKEIDDMNKVVTILNLGIFLDYTATKIVSTKNDFEMSDHNNITGVVNEGR